MIGSRYAAAIKLLGSASMLGVVLVGPAPRSEHRAGSGGRTRRGHVDARSTSASAAHGPSRRRTRTSVVLHHPMTTPDGKTIVPRALIHEQADLRLNEALRNVPGISRR